MTRRGPSTNVVRNNANQSSSAASEPHVVQLKSGLSWRSVVAALVLLGVFACLQTLLPLKTAVQIGADEGFELAKATSCLHGNRLYTEVWNDQPPLHTWIVTEAIKHISHSILMPRLVTSAFTLVLLAGLFTICLRVGGLATATLATALLIFSPGFLELSSSCMLEIPSLATAVAGLCVLLTARRTKWRSAEIGSGVLFGLALQIKLISIIYLPLAALILLLRQFDRIPVSVGWHPSTCGGPGNSVNLDRWPHNWDAWRSVLRCGISGALIFFFMLVLVFIAADLLIDNGAYLSHFGQSWRSHFGQVKSFEYGSPAQHAFDWKILLNNWDMTVPALFGAGWLASRWRQRPIFLLPVAWLALALLVFTIHRPWWQYYYIHIAVPLCWCAAAGYEVAWHFVQQKLSVLWQAGLKRRERIGVGARGAVLIAGLFGLFVLSGAGWMGARACLQITAVRHSPQLYTAIVLKQMEHFKPFGQWIYTDDLIYSFHADIPMPPPLAVVPLKRLWSGDMTDERIAEEVSRYRPGLILLRSSVALVPFQELLDTEYRMVYVDQQHRLYARKDVIMKAEKREQSGGKTPGLKSPKSSGRGG